MERVEDGPVESLQVTSDMEAYERAVSHCRTAAEVLQTAADTIVSGGLFRRAVLSLHDQDSNLGPIGYNGVPREMIEAARHAPRVRRDVREAMLQERFLIGNSYFIPAEAGIDLTSESRYVPSGTPTLDDDEWQSGDELFVPLRSTSGAVMGFCSVDEPFTGHRPDGLSLRPLEGIIRRAAERLEVLELQERVRTLEHRLCLDINLIYEFDLVSNRVATVNGAVSQFIGMSPADVIGLSLDDWVRRFVHPDDRERARAFRPSLSIDPATDALRAFSREYRVVHRDGSIRVVSDRATFVVDDDGQVVALEGVIHDVTELDRLAGQLAEAERRYRLVADNTRDLIYAYDNTGHMFYASPSIARLGLKPEKFLGTHFSEWLTDDPINQAAYEAFDAEISRGETVPPFVLELHARDGHTLMVEVNESLIRDGAGRVIGVQGVGRDITDREPRLRSLQVQRGPHDSASRTWRGIVAQSGRRQQEMLELNRRLREKNADLESFVHIVSHDLRSPLVSIRGLLGQLRRSYSGLCDERGRDILRRADHEALRLARLIGDLSVYARSGADPGDRRSVDALLLLETVWTRLV